jgi:alkaline phosphatase D
MNKLTFLFFFSFTFHVFAQSAKPTGTGVAAGPMVGYSEMKEVMLWIQTQKAAKVKIGYWDLENPKVKMYTEEVQTQKSSAFTAHLLADEVLPSKKYAYEVYLNAKLVPFSYPLRFQTQTLWQYRTDPPAFSFAVGSCAYINEEEYDRPGTPYGKSTEIFKKINDKKPNFMIWGGDNIYTREVDWFTKTGFNHRYSHTRKHPDMQALLASVHNYAIWDDHDYGPNNHNRSFQHKNIALEAFKNFWANPNYVFEKEGITGTFVWEDCQFFLMDNMWNRSPNESNEKNKDFFGEKQLNWLIEALKTSSAPFKFVVSGGQTINSAVVFENMSTYPEERKKLLDRLASEKISGLIFLSGDRHHTNLQKLERGDLYPLYDLTVSPLTSGAGKPTEEEYKNGNILPGYELNNTQNFGILEISGKRTDRVLKINIFDANGEKKWDYSISAKDLRAKQ